MPQPVSVLTQPAPASAESIIPLWQGSAAVVMPAFNEATAIRSVVEEVRRELRLPVIVIDDSSDDATCSEARAGGAIVLPLAVQLGAWGATQAGIRYAIAAGYQYVLTVDADGQHPPEWGAALLDTVAGGHADVAIGSFTERGSRLRKIAWHYLRWISGIGIDDLTSGYRAYNSRAIQLLAGWRATFLDFQDVGVLAMLMASNLQVRDVEVTMHARRDGGASRIFRSWLAVGYYMLHTTLLGITKRPIRRWLPRPVQRRLRKVKG